MAEKKYLTRENFYAFLDILKKSHRVFLPVKKGEQRFWKEYDKPSEDIVIGEVRAFEPLKSFFTLAREIVAEGFSPDVPHGGDKPFALVGVKACDMKGMKVQDHVFLDHDYTDIFYKKMRDDNLIITSDCTRAIDTCFCLAMGVKPYSEEGFDINISEEDNGFLVEVGSEKGRKAVEKSSYLFQPADDTFVARRDRIRAGVEQEVRENVERNSVPEEKDLQGMIEKNFDSEIWEDEAKTCVECGACTIICPTCHCFLLYDQKDGEKMARLRIWDSCMIKDYAHVAGGGNARPWLWERLRNRFEKKFDFFPKVADIYACTGCGRCVSGCPAKIDIRKVLRRLVDDAS